MSPRERLLSIGDVASATGLRPSALRYYEDAGLIKPAARVGGRRHYDASVLRRLAIVALCQEVGFTVSEIGQLLGTGRRARERWRKFAEEKLVQLDARIDRAKATRRLLRSVIACGCGDPTTCELAQGASNRRLLQIGSPQSPPAATP